MVFSESSNLIWLGVTTKSGRRKPLLTQIAVPHALKWLIDHYWPEYHSSDTCIQTNMTSETSLIRNTRYLSNNVLYS